MEEPPPAPDQGVLRLALYGDVDILRRQELDELVAQFASSDSRDLVLDLAAVPFLDSTGLTMLVQLQQLAEARGGRVQVVATSAPVRRALEITGVDRLVQVGGRPGPG